MAQLIDWTGGLSTRLSTHLININEAIVYTNIDNSTASLMPLRDSLYEQQNFGSNTSFYFFNGSWIAKGYNTNFIEYQNKLYYSDAVGIPQKTSDGINFYNLGIVKPQTKPTTVANDAINPDSVKVRQYCYTYYNSVDGTESAPSAYSNELSYTTNNITISNLVVSTDPQVTNIRLYRLGGALTEMSLVATLAKTTTTYVDTLDDISIDGSILESQNGGQAPSGLRFMIEANSMFFGAKADKLYYSDVAYPNYWSPFFFIDFDDDITGLGSTPNGTLVFTKAKTYIVTGTSPLTLTKILLHSSQGCINHKTIQYVDNNLLWLSMDGICSSNGSSVEVITLQKLGKVTVTSIGSAIWDNQYYLFHTTGTLVLDFRYGGLIFKNLSIIANGVWYSSTFDKLYYVKTDGTLNSLYNHATNYLTYTYKSGRISEGSITTLKTYKVFYVYIEGTANMKIYIDGTLSLTHTLTNGFNEVKTPQSDRNGYYIEFEITGTGKVLEIEYKVEGRQNGR